MTCVIGFKDEDYIYIGADSLGSNGITKTVRKDKKVFQKNDMLIGFSGSYRMGQIIQYKFVMPEHPKEMDVDTYMRSIFIDTMIDCLTENGHTKIIDNERFGASFIIAYKNRMFEIDEDYHVGESVEDYIAIGSGAEVALGAIIGILKYCKDIKTSKLVTSALEASEEVSCGVGRPFVIMRRRNDEDIVQG
tara:strand:- start:2092 stop:2664 length:573 start_codon:yes stop_codon:yes gene_type:complete